jgi:RHS repeat-associated protein
MVWDAVTNADPLLLDDGVTAYIYGPGGAPVEQVRGDTVTYLLGDQLGSTALVTNQNGDTVATYAYDPFGKVTTQTGTDGTDLRFAGQYTDTDTGTDLVYLRARYYDPATGQFLTTDPAQALTRSPYGYAGGNPLNFTDPSGELAPPAIGAIVGGVVGAVSAGGTYAASNWGNIDGQGLTGAVIGGGASGAIQGWCIGSGYALVGSTACGAAAGAVGDTISQSIGTGDIAFDHLATATAVGGIGGAVGGVGAPRITAAMVQAEQRIWGSRIPGGMSHWNLVPSYGSWLGRRMQIANGVNGLWSFAIGLPSELTYTWWRNAC